MQRVRSEAQWERSEGAEPREPTVGWRCRRHCCQSDSPPAASRIGDTIPDTSPWRGSYGRPRALTKRLGIGAAGLVAPNQGPRELTSAASVWASCVVLAVLAAFGTAPPILSGTATPSCRNLQSAVRCGGVPDFIRMLRYLRAAAVHRPGPDTRCKAGRPAAVRSEGSEQVEAARRADLLGHAATPPVQKRRVLIASEAALAGEWHRYVPGRPELADPQVEVTQIRIPPLGNPTSAVLFAEHAVQHDLAAVHVANLVGWYV